MSQVDPRGPSGEASRGEAPPPFLGGAGWIILLAFVGLAITLFVAGILRRPVPCPTGTTLYACAVQSTPQSTAPGVDAGAPPVLPELCAADVVSAGERITERYASSPWRVTVRYCFPLGLSGIDAGVEGK